MDRFNDYIVYNDKSKNKAADEISKYKPDFYGTDILTPIKMAYELDSGPYKKNIFLLTDGEVNNPDEIVNYVHNKTFKEGSSARTHAFGIGDGCDVALCKSISENGRGTFSFAADGTPDLRHLVIKALKKASMESLKDCRVKWN
eukprot:CAMPEP_0116875818 /NCGR_PEP_ID=MMETSP0463-20121206/7923_1 /TAXON_ID=181622 /ORGANISM="Strombidinopsis sp, Strain SopsisLIS2011" /LENGTH=143 /DNA_ID=CAMNT_0004522129 /DNA_START=1082 /DNA_END=1513 /DNA_ORIENTATION=+